ncbi:MAG TPA: hypothetical protein VIF12_03330, partial [Micavibrio sp.]
MSKDGKTAATVGIVALFGLVAVLNSPLMVDPEGARRILLDSEKLTDVEIKGYSWFGCSKDDLWHTEFTAKNYLGKEV